MRIRNVRRYADPKCSTNRNHEGRGKSKFQKPITNETLDAGRKNLAALSYPLEIETFFGIWNLELGSS
jgi:hypothetical protein